MVRVVLYCVTCRYACNMKVVRLVRERSIGNSVTQTCTKLHEQHEEKWLERGVQYMNTCVPFAEQSGCAPSPLPQPPVLPQPRWLMSVYLRDLMSRMDDVKAKLTSTFGSILKMDSTKKLTRKLVGKVAETAQWATDVGNEYGAVLTCVMTTAKVAGLRRMASGLVNRYKDAGVPPPSVLYVDRDCCSRVVTGSLCREWPDVAVRLDIWHLMRRLSQALKTESHQLYGVFMSKLSSCIFEWDAADYQQLCAAKAPTAGVSPSEAAKLISR